MPVFTLEGVVELGQIRLDPDVRLPEGARAYVVVPGMECPARVASPRLLDPADVGGFALDVGDVPDGADR